MMIPLWMAPLSIVCGNSMVLKPSEKGPGASMILARLAQQAGIPDGVLQVRVSFPILLLPPLLLTSLLFLFKMQVVHGAHDTVNFMCDSPVIKAISFVGSNAAGEHVYERGTRQGKRVQVRTNLAH